MRGIDIAIELENLRNLVSLFEGKRVFLSFFEILTSSTVVTVLS